MDDILFGNNNQATINRLAKRSYRANKQRNVFVTIALFLTAFMITSCLLYTSDAAEICSV